jgi:hypothetical protein
MGREARQDDELARRRRALITAQMNGAPMIAPKQIQTKWSPLEFAQRVACSIQQGQQIPIGQTPEGQVIQIPLPNLFDMHVEMVKALPEPLTEDSVDQLAWLECIARFQRETAPIVERFARRHGWKPEAEKAADPQVNEEDKFLEPPDAP